MGILQKPILYYLWDMVRKPSFKHQTGMATLMLVLKQGDYIAKKPALVLGVLELAVPPVSSHLVHQMDLHSAPPPALPFSKVYDLIFLGTGHGSQCGKIES